MPRVLIAEDSKVVAQILQRLFEAAPDFQVVGIAEDGEQAVRMAAQLQPDVITMDVIMPKLDGVKATEKIMEETPTPIVIISSHVNDKEMKVTFRTLAAGALSVLEKPEDIFSPSFEARHRSFLNTVRAMADVKVYRRRRKPAAEIHHADPVLTPMNGYDLVVIGSSTGGPQALKRVLSSLPSDYPLPIVVAQHISRGFTVGLVDWLGGETSLSTVLARNGMAVKPGHVYFAPDGTDVRVENIAGNLTLSISEEKPEGVLCPNVDVLFRSAASSVGSRVVCGLLTGMGVDGADGMADIRGAGGWTFAEAEESCVVYGMPQAAADRGAAREMLHVDAVFERLLSVARRDGGA